MTPEDHARVLDAIVQRYHSHMLTPEDVAACEAGAQALRQIAKDALLRRIVDGKVRLRPVG